MGRDFPSWEQNCLWRNLLVRTPGSSRNGTEESTKNDTSRDFSKNLWFPVAVRSVESSTSRTSSVWRNLKRNRPTIRGGEDFEIL